MQTQMPQKFNICFLVKLMHKNRASQESIYEIREKCILTDAPICESFLSLVFKIQISDYMCILTFSFITKYHAWRYKKTTILTLTINEDKP